MLVGYSVKLTAITALYLYMYFENKRRDRDALDRSSEETEGIENGMLVSLFYRVYRDLGSATN